MVLKQTCPNVNCDNDKFYIEIIHDCSDCENNGAYDPESGEYIYTEEDVKRLGLQRDEALEDMQCKFDTNWNNGCYIFTCTECGRQWNLALCEE